MQPGYRPSGAEAARANTFLAPSRPKTVLLEWKPFRAGALLGRAKIRLPNGLEIADIAIFAKDDRFWAQLPSQPQRDADGRPVTDDRGKPRYISSIKWSTRELQDGFSTTLVDLVRAAHPDAFRDAS